MTIVFVTPSQPIYVREVDDRNSWEEMKSLIGCDLIEAHLIYVKGRTFWLFIDEEGRLKEESRYCLITNRYGVIVAPCCIVAPDEKHPDEYRGLTEEEWKLLLRNMTTREITELGETIALINDH